MVGETLRDLRERVADRHEDDGRFYVSCARTGERPVPVAGKRFPTRESAAAAAELAAAYRAELRSYDPRLPRYDLVASEDPGRDGPFDPAGIADGPAEAASVSDFCHDVAAAVFEVLSVRGETRVERGVMDAYLHSAESVTDPDELCLVLLATMAREIDARLAPDSQWEVLRTAANRLGAPSESGDPMDATLARLDGLSLVGDYAVASAGAVAPDGVRERRSWTVAVEGYAFDRVDGRVPTLPLAVELLRRLPDETVAVSDVRATGRTEWECVVSTAVSAPRAVSLATVESG